VRTTTLSLAREEPDTVPSRSAPEPPRVLHPGTLLRGRWRILRFLGQGGMAVVHEAVDIATGERVALKVLPAHAWDDADALASLRDELLVARRVSHHNVCRVHEVYLEPSAGSGEPAFLTMEFLEGETLAARLQREGRLDEDTTLGIARQLAAGLQAAHQVCVVHRDLKPGNVMLVPDGDGVRAVITDFGVAWAGARSMSSGDRADRIVGSPAYMSPEQVEGGRISPASDIFAFGVLLYELVTGVLPFHRGTPEEVTRSRRISTPMPPSCLVAALSSRWNRTILSCLRSDPEQRPPSTAAVVRSLERDRRTAGLRRWAIAAAVVAVAAGLVPWGIERLQSSSATERRLRANSGDLQHGAAQPRSARGVERSPEAVEASRSLAPDSMPGATERT
jgi:serine/threonine protein kinase